LAKTLTEKQLVAQVVMRELERQLKTVLRKMSPRDARIVALHVTGARNLRARQIVTRTWLEEISAMEEARMRAFMETPEGQKRVTALMSEILQ
jgi:predicted HD phosphohydrolase